MINHLKLQIACPHLEIEVDTDTPIVTIESAQGEDDGQIMVREERGGGEE